MVRENLGILVLLFVFVFETVVSHAHPGGLVQLVGGDSALKSQFRVHFLRPLLRATLLGRELWETGFAPPIPSVLEWGCL